MVTGTTRTDLIREAMRARAHKLALTHLAREADVGLAASEDFAYGRGRLADAAVHRLVAQLWNGTVEWLPEVDLLRSVPPREPARLLGYPPAPFSGPTAVFEPRPAQRTPQPVIPVPPPRGPQARMGRVKGTGANRSRVEG